MLLKVTAFYKNKQHMKRSNLHMGREERQGTKDEKIRCVQLFAAKEDKKSVTAWGMCLSL